MKLSDLSQKTKRLAIDIDGSGTLELDYYIHAYTPELEAQLVGVETRPATALAALIRRLVAWWSLEDDDGKMYPITDEAVQKLPLQFMMSVFQRVAEDMRPNPPTAGS